MKDPQPLLCEGKARPDIFEGCDCGGRSQFNSLFGQKTFQKVGICVCVGSWREGHALANLRKEHFVFAV